ncbi:MAG: hypothetical protein JWM05_2558 [Acidimicrobiales bacterium]|nr:hypothetical protein [Acidimicrobiales bacterium]
MVLVGYALLLVVVALQSAGRWRAAVEVDNSGIVLRHRLGIGRRRVVVPMSLQTAKLYRTKGSSHPQSGAAGETLALGTYLRASSGRRSVTVRTKSKTALDKRWEGIERSHDRTSWDVELDLHAFQRLLDALAENGTIRRVEKQAR